mmetsp:Transcript_135505/g.342814  ORF Transcript_135505/g.342814 Transcript_135505/m.342814 type:complete len:203 (+) Transcript_135505:98-706(+)
MAPLEASVGDEGLLLDWRRAASELRSIESVMEELREELRGFEVRRKMIASKEVSLRRRLIDHGVEAVDLGLQEEEEEDADRPDDAARTTPSSPGGGAGAGAGAAAPKATAAVFCMDDGEVCQSRSPDSAKSTGRDTSPASSMEDWEQGLEVFNTVGSRDRAAKLRAHMLLATTKQSPTKQQAATRHMDAVELLHTALASRCQ